MNTTIRTYTITRADGLFEHGQPLCEFETEVLSGDDYETPRARALFKALGVSPEAEDLQLGITSDGRWGLLGLTVEGHPFAVEVAGCEHVSRRAGDPPAGPSYGGDTTLQCGRSANPYLGWIVVGRPHHAQREDCTRWYCDKHVGAARDINPTAN